VSEPGRTSRKDEWEEETGQQQCGKGHGGRDRVAYREEVVAAPEQGEGRGDQRGDPFGGLVGLACAQCGERGVQPSGEPVLFVGLRFAVAEWRMK
jgi:hypothetical protein